LPSSLLRRKCTWPAPGPRPARSGFSQP
jgi:hypothetical protein